MAGVIYNLASVNLDSIVAVERIPKPGETIAGKRSKTSLGGKGSNISVAIQRAGQIVVQISALHREDKALRRALNDFGIKGNCIEASDEFSGEAIILLDQLAENSIVVIAGANRCISDKHIEASLAPASKQDWLIMQNETNGQLIAANIAKKKNMKIAYVAAPFEAAAALELLPYIDLLILNETEAAQLSSTAGNATQAMDGMDVLVTLGSQGAVLKRKTGNIHVAGYKVKPLDTTAAGDTFCGYYVASIVAGNDEKQALQIANAAAALSVQKLGAADSIPLLSEVMKFIES